MTIIGEREIERIVERKLATAAPAAAPAAAPRRTAAPPVRFSPLFAEAPPDARRRRKFLVGASVAFHVVLVVVVMLMPRRAQTIDEPVLPIEIVFTAPIPSIPEMTMPRALPKPAPKPKPEPKPEPLAEPPSPVAEAPKPLPKPVLPEPAPVMVARLEPPRPRPEIKTGFLDELPSGPAIVASRTSRSAVVASGFEGEAGTASSPARPGRVTQAAFDETPAVTRKTRTGTGVVSDTGFAEEAAAPRKRERERAGGAGSLDADVEIVTKPKPVYTDAARVLKLEGDVVLDVVFEAKGTLRVIAVAQGLGHGLDEAAIDAAKKIQFTPARRDGTPVDHAAKLRVVFRLA